MNTNQNFFYWLSVSLFFTSISVLGQNVDISGTYQVKGETVLSTEGSQNIFLGTEAGENNSGVSNTFVGSSAGNSNTNGRSNTFVGKDAGSDNASGNFNTYLGYLAGTGSTTGSNNVFIGPQAGSGIVGSFKLAIGSGTGTPLIFGEFNNQRIGINNNSPIYTLDVNGDINLTGNIYQNGSLLSVNSPWTLNNQNNIYFAHNVRIGSTANPNYPLDVLGDINTTGVYRINGKQVFSVVDNINSVFIGIDAGENYTSGFGNIFIGEQAGQELTSGSSNTFLGYQAGEELTSGGSNVFIGYRAGEEYTSSTDNVFIGDEAGEGLADSSTGNRNTFIGSNSGERNTSGGENTFVGYSAGSENSTGEGNTFVGKTAGQDNQSGDNNTCIGFEAGDNVVNRSHTVCLGYRAGRSKDASNKLYIDVNTDLSEPSLIYGEFSGSRGVGVMTESIGSYAFYVNGAAYSTSSWQSSDKRFKSNIQPLSNSLEQLQKLQGTTYQFNTQKLKKQKINLPEGKQMGLIAQDLQKVYPELVREDGNGYLAVNYTGLIPVLVEAVKEQQTQIDALQNELKEIKNEKTEMSNSTTSKQIGNSTQFEAVLFQNTPNPFGQETSIQYIVPQSAQQASILIFNMQGEFIRRINIEQFGEGKLIIRGNELKAGIYLYSLLVDDREIATKRMILTK